MAATFTTAFAIFALLLLAEMVTDFRHLFKRSDAGGKDCSATPRR